MSDDVAQPVIEDESDDSFLDRYFEEEAERRLLTPFHRLVLPRGLRMLTKPCGTMNGYWFAYTAGPLGVLDRSVQIRRGSRMIVESDGHRFFCDMTRHVARCRAKLLSKVGLSRRDKLIYVHAVERLRVGETLINHFWSWSTTMRRIS